MSDPIGTLPRAALDELYAACKPDPTEPIQVTLTRKQWSAMLDHLNAELQPKLENKTATEAEIDIVVQLACALIGAGQARMNHEIVKRMLKGGGA